MGGARAEGAVALVGAAQEGGPRDRGRRCALPMLRLLHLMMLRGSLCAGSAAAVVALSSQA